LIPRRGNRADSMSGTANQFGAPEQWLPKSESDLFETEAGI